MKSISAAVEKVLLSREDVYHYSMMIDNKTLSLEEQKLPEYLATRITAIFKPFSEALVDEEVRYPASSWQHIKKDFFPEWLLKRFPVKEIVERVKIKAAYPYVSLPDERHWFYKKTDLYNELLETKE